MYIFIYIDSYMCDSYMCDMYETYIYKCVCVHIYIARAHRAAVWPRQARCQTLSFFPCATVFFLLSPVRNGLFCRFTVQNAKFLKRAVDSDSP